MPASEHLAHNGTNAKHILNLFQESAPKLRRKLQSLRQVAIVKVGLFV